MPLLRRIVLGVAVAAALGVLFLDWELVWQFDQVTRDASRVQALEHLAVLLFGLAGLYSILFLLGPFFSAQIMERQTDKMIVAVQAQLRAAASEIVGLKAGIERWMREQPGRDDSGREYLQVAGQIRSMNNQIAQIHHSLGVLVGAGDLDAARSHLAEALALAPNSPESAWVHYTCGCLLARHGHYPAAVEELEAAFRTPSAAIAEKFLADLEQDGALHQLANTVPFSQMVDRLILAVSVAS